MTDDDLLPGSEDAGAIDAPIEDATADQTSSETPPTLEEVAEGMGWTPQDKWRGDPEKWRPAHDFVAKTVDVNKSLNSRLERMEREMSNVARTGAIITERELAKQRQELLEKRQEAFETGDSDAFNQVDKQLAELPKFHPSSVATAPEVEAWVEKHSSWFGKDQEATNWAQRRTQQLADQGLGFARQLAAVEREMADLFPDLMPQEKPKPKGAPLTQPGNRGGPAVRKGFASLPPDAQKAAIEFESRRGISRDEYARIYYEEEGA